MKIENVIENLKYLISEDCTEAQQDYKEEIKMAIVALEKDELTKPLRNYGNKYQYCCPRCGFMFCHKEEDFKLIHNYKMYRYCPDCGQRIDWSDK